MKEGSSLNEIMLQLTLIVQVKDIERINADLGFQIFLLDMFATSLS